MSTPVVDNLAEARKYSAAERKQFLREIRERQGDSSFPDEPADLATLFRLYDIDGSGQLSLEEFVEVINDLRRGKAKRGHKFTKVQVRRFMDWVDADDNKEVDLMEFTQFFQNVQKVESFEENIAREASKQNSQRNTMLLYFLMVILAFAYFFTAYLTESGTDSATDMTVAGLIASSIALTIGILYIFIFPVVDIFYEDARRDGTLDKYYRKIVPQGVKLRPAKKTNKNNMSSERDDRERMEYRLEKEALAQRQKEMNAHGKLHFSFRNCNISNDQYSAKDSEMRKKDIEDYWELRAQQGSHVDPNLLEDDGRGGARQIWQDDRGGSKEMFGAVLRGSDSKLFGDRDYTIGSRAEGFKAARNGAYKNDRGWTPNSRKKQRQLMDRPNTAPEGYNSPQRGGRQGSNLRPNTTLALMDVPHGFEPEFPALQDAIGRPDFQDTLGRPGQFGRPGATDQFGRPATTGQIGRSYSNEVERRNDGTPRPINSRGGMRGGRRSGHGAPLRGGPTSQVVYYEDDILFGGAVLRGDRNGLPCPPASAPGGSRPAQLKKRDIYTPDLYNEAIRAQVENPESDYFQTIMVPRKWRNEWVDNARAKFGILEPPKKEESDSDQEQPENSQPQTKLFKTKAYG